VYFKKLDAVKNTSAKTFDAVSFTDKLWKEQMPSKMDSAVELTAFMNMLSFNSCKAFKQYSNALAIGNYRYSLVKATATVIAINKDDISLSLPYNGSSLNLKLATEFVYGNAIRDASKLIDVKDFTNSTDLNNISEAFNNKVRKEVLHPFLNSVKKEDKIEVVAAVEINKEHIKFDELELIPVRIKIVQQ
jgi:predicted lipoprotein